MKLFLIALLGLLAPEFAAAQVVVHRDGTFPAPWVPSVSPEEYPAMLECTLERRWRDIEAILGVRWDLYAKVQSAGRLAPTDAEYDALQVLASDGRRVEEPRLFVEIIKSCHGLKEGYPIGFWPDTLYEDWRKSMAFAPLGEPLNSEKFAKCLAKYRPSLVAQYLATVIKSEAKAIYTSFFEQRVCKSDMPVWIKEKQVRRNLQRLRSN